MLTFQSSHMHWKITFGAVHIISYSLPSHEAWVILHQPVGHFVLRRNHFGVASFLVEVPSLPERKFGHVIFYFDFAGSTVVKFDGEGGVTLYDRWHCHVNILGGNLVNLCLWRFQRLLEFFRRDFEITRFSSEGVDGITLRISVAGDVTVDFLFVLAYVFRSF